MIFSKSFENSLDVFNEIIKAIPNDPKQYYRLGLVQLALGEKELARENLLKSLKLASNRPFSDRQEVEAVLNKIDSQSK